MTDIKKKYIVFQKVLSEISRNEMERNTSNYNNKIVVLKIVIRGQ